MDPDRLSPSRGLQAAGLLFAGSGVATLLAAFLATNPAVALLIVTIAVILLAAGVGLLQRRLWGWYLGLLVTASGALVVAVRLAATGAAEWPSLLPPLGADLVLLLALVLERPRRPAAPLNGAA